MCAVQESLPVSCSSSSSCVGACVSSRWMQKVIIQKVQYIVLL